MDDRKIAVLRIVVAAAALVMEYAGVQPSRAVGMALAANLVYSGIVYLLARRQETFRKPIIVLLICVDVLVYSLLASVHSGSPNPAVFVLYFFTILVASGRLGAVEGFAVAACSGALYIAVTSVVVHPGAFNWRQTLLPAACMTVLGSIVAYWTAAEFRYKERLGLLKELSLTANPRLGVDRTAGLFMQRVLEFFGADICVFAQMDPHTGEYQFREATRFRPQGGAQIFKLPDIEGGSPLHLLPRNAVAVYTEGGYWRRAGSYRIADSQRRTAAEQPVDHAASPADWLNARSFMAVPLRRIDVFQGYLCLGAIRSDAFKVEDALFLSQVADQIMPVLEHIRLVDHLASDAADEERRRIARSIHDRIIQPYLGLQIGLKSVHQMIRSEIQSNSADPSQEKWHRTATALESLISMTRDGVAELRQYVHGLRRSTGGRAILVESISRYAAKFETATGVHVTVIDRIGQLDIQDRLAADIFQMAAEALSNVHRHTTANAVTLVLETGAAGTVVLRVENEITAKGAPREFMPGSISDRAGALGGKTEVDVHDGRTVVRVEIPL